MLRGNPSPLRRSCRMRVPPHPVSSPARPEPLPPAGGRTDLLATALLSWVAGFVDTAGFIGLDRLFPAHVTGNLEVAAAALVGAGGERAWVRLGVIPVFMAAVVLATVLLRRGIRLWALVVLEAWLLLAHALLCAVPPAARWRPRRERGRDGDRRLGRRGRHGPADRPDARTLRPPRPHHGDDRQPHPACPGMAPG